jgi:hypothetical protein
VAICSTGIREHKIGVREREINAVTEIKAERERERSRERGREKEREIRLCDIAQTNYQ